MSAIDTWERFLASLQSEGGKMLIEGMKVLIMVGLIGFILSVAEYANLHNHPVQEKTREILIGFISLLFGELIARFRLKT